MGLFSRCVLLVCASQGVNGLEGIAHTCDGVGLGDNWGAESAHGVAEIDPCVCVTTAPPSTSTIPLLRAHQSAVLPPSRRQV